MKYFDISLLEDSSAHGLKSGVFQPTVQPRLHRHSEIELNYLERGTITYMFGGERVMMEMGQFALFWALIPHQIIQADEQSILHWLTLPFAYFLQRQLPDVLTQPVTYGKFVPGPLDDEQGSIFDTFQRWHKDLKHIRHDQALERKTIVLLEIEVYLRRLALDIVEGTLSTGKNTNDQSTMQMHELSKVEQMAHFIAQHYTEPLPAKAIADVVHLHPSYAMNIFVKHFGLSILDYITQFRLSHAQRLLITTDENASEIALMAGFGSVSRFYATFNCLCGCSPGTYRTRYRQTWREHNGNALSRQDQPASSRFKLSDQSLRFPE